MYINLTGLNILVTGASSGIGKAIAIKLAEAGATIAIHYNKNAREAESLSHILGNESKTFQADLSNPGEAGKLFDRVILEMESIEILINNAGIAGSVKEDAPVEEWIKVWEEVMQVNLNSAALLCKKSIEFMIAKKNTGRIINISSGPEIMGDPAKFMAYTSSKAGIAALTKTIAASYGKHGIRAFGIAPGFVKSEMTRTLFGQIGDEHAFGNDSQQRMTEPKDIAPLVTFIASGMADHSNGSTFEINAGSYMQ